MDTITPHPRVSVVVPCFNQGQFVADAIASVHAQTYNSIEIIVVEDCSTDGFTREFIQAQSFANTTKLFNKTNMGVAETRNAGIKAARGVFILPLDADDKLAPEFISTAVAILEADQCDVVYSRVRNFGSNADEFKLPPFSLRTMLSGNVVVNTAMYRKAAWAEVGGYSGEMCAGLEDWDFWLSLAERGNRFHRIDKPLFFYRRHGPSRTNSAQAMERVLRQRIFARHRDLYLRYGVTDAELCLNRRKQRRVETTAKWVSTATRRLFGWDVEERQEPQKKPIKLFYFNPPGQRNFGDQLNVLLLQRLTGRPIQQASELAATHLCIGSLLEQFLQKKGSCSTTTTPLAVWGAGFIAAPGLHPSWGGESVESFQRPLSVHAIRGRLSLQRLRAMGQDVSRTVLGDPGLLAGMLVPPMAPVRSFRLGLVPHYVDEHERVFRHLCKRLPAVRLLRVADPPKKFLRDVRQCDVVISSAMHGLIAADALGIPNIRVRVSGRLTGGDYKFIDYYSAFDICPAPLSVADLWDLTESDLLQIEKTYPIAKEKVQRIVAELLNACPFLMRAGETAATITANMAA